MRKQKRLGPIDFSHYQIFIRGITDVSPHGEIFNEEFKKVILMDGVLELFQVFRFQLRFAQQTPVDRILKGNFVGRRFPAITDNVLAQSMLDTLGSLATFGFSTRRGNNVLHLGDFLFFRSGGVLETKGQGIVTVRFGRVVERSGHTDKKKKVKRLFMPSNASNTLPSERLEQRENQFSPIGSERTRLC
jgi:hypothetical protein